MVYRPVESIEVVCWGKPVGALTLDPRSGVYAFEYYPSFARSGWELSPLLLPSNTQGSTVFPGLSHETFYGLPAFIADSLPDNFGNLLINSWMATQGIGRERITPLDRLAYMGKRAMGALEFKPALRAESRKPSALEMGNLVESARRALLVELSNETQNPYIELKGAATQNGDRDLQELIAIGTSAGGARAKAVVGFNEQAGLFVSGQFDLPKGFRHFIIKFDIQSASGNTRPYGRIEYAYYLMAKACGIDMQPSRLYEAAGRAHFMTERFDRTAQGEKLHTQTLCALAALDFNVRDTHDYNQVFLAIQDLNLGYQAIDEMFLRMVFNVANANNDDHTKNISFTMDTQGTWRLAPAYDLTHAHNPDGLWTARHLMAVNGRFEQITRADVLEIAERYHVATPSALLERVLEVSANWRKYAEMAGVAAAHRGRIERDIRNCSENLR